MARFGGTGVITQPVDGSAAHGSADRGNPLKIGGRASTTLPTAVDPGDRVDAYFDQYGRLHCVLEGWSADVGVVSGNEQHGAADVGNPVKIGGKASASEPLPVDNGDRVDAYFDEYGRQHVVVDASLGGEVVGNSAHDAPDAGNPIKFGGRAHITRPDAVGHGDRVNAYFNQYGALAVFSDADQAVRSEGSAPSRGMQILVDTGSVSKFAQGDTNGNLKTVIASEIPAGSNEIGGINLVKVVGNAVATGSGDVTTGTLRVAIATDDVVATTVIAALGDTNTALGGVNTALGDVNTALGGVDTALGEIQTALGALTDIQTALGSVETAVGGVQTAIESLELSLPSGPSGVITESWEALTEPGATSAKECIGYVKHTIQLKIENVNTSVTVRVEGSLDGEEWFNLDAEDSDLIIDEGGVYGMFFEGSVGYIRFMFVSEDGGTDAILTATYLGVS